MQSMEQQNATALAGKKIVLGVTGGIAAYKAVEITSRLRKAGAEVHVIMTRGAENFVTELTFREISNQPVTTDMWAKVPHYHVEHIALATLVPATRPALRGMVDGTVAANWRDAHHPLDPGFFGSPAIPRCLQQSPGRGQPHPGPARLLRRPYVPARR